MNRIFFLAAALSTSFLAQGRPRVIEESAWFDPPDASLAFFGDSVAIDGDWALATALRSSDGTFEYPYQQLALLYHRIGGTWRYDRVLVDDPTDAESWNYPWVAMKDGVAAVSTSPLRTFRLANGSWAMTDGPFPATVGEDAWANGLARIDGTTLAAIAGRCRHGAVTSEIQDDGSTQPRPVLGNERPCLLANDAGSLDVDGNTLVVTNPQEEDTGLPTQTNIYVRNVPGAQWKLQDSLPIGDFGRGVAVRGDDLFVGGWSPYGNDIYHRDGAAWAHTGYLPTISGFTRRYDGAFYIAKSDEFVLLAASMSDDLRGAIAVYRRDARGSYEQVALLASSNGDELGPVVEISGRTVIVSGHARDSADHGRLYFFELPASFAVPAVIQDDFEDGDESGWDEMLGEFTVVRRGVTRVLRQSQTEGQGRMVLTASNGDTQSVSADIRPTAFSGDDRWVGLATRYRDPSNYYYVSLRNTGSVTLRRKREGVITTLASIALPIAANGNYRVRLESVGSRHRVFVNGERLFEAFDAALPSGRVALLTHYTAADFDNVLVTPSPLTTVYDNDVLNGSECRVFTTDPELRLSGSGQWDCTYTPGPSSARPPPSAWRARLSAPSSMIRRWNRASCRRSSRTVARRATGSA